MIASSLLLFPALVLGRGLLVGPDVVKISKEWNDVFPYRNFNRNVTVPFWETGLLPDPAYSELEEDLETIGNASFVVYDDAFYKLLGIANHTVPKTVEAIFTFPPPSSYAQRQIHDGTVDVPETNTLFTAELFSPKPGYGMQAIPYIWKTDLSNPSAPVTEKAYPNPPLTIANGATYFNGSVYWAQEGNFTTPSAIVRMDPVTLKTEVVKNNFYGHRFNSLNDLVITAEGIAFFTDGYYGYANFNDTLFPELANGVYRWDMNTGNIKMVAGAAEGAFFNPNGVALSSDHTKLYVTNRGETSADPHGGRTIYAHDILFHGISNREIFVYVDAGFPDGIKTDREGRVYGAVVGAVDVFDQVGTLLGRIKVDADDVAVNMAWAGKWLYIFGRNKIYRVELETEEV
ncbi:hypothetical protein BJX66DRAFT_330197 [Aspergillus keveii]|uniref:SMP-30/Gluconolactonase/LRE-like region domain-containing protein n=1 Tax=Aspergillus keveii TaxID=714993 RepID=A0ABR4FLI7_9EURO